MAIRLNPLEARIVGILVDWYPITVQELKDELGLRQSEIDRALKSLMVKGVIALEPLSDKSFVRLLMPGIDVNSVREKGRGKKARTRQAPPGPDDSIMYR